MLEPQLCQFSKCGLWFRDHYDLTAHIEATHVVAAKEAFDTDRNWRIQEEIEKAGGKTTTSSIIADNLNSFPQRISMSVFCRMNYDVPEPTPIKHERRRMAYNPFKKHNPQTTTGLADEIPQEDDEKHQISQIVQRISSESAMFEQKTTQQQATRITNYTPQMQPTQKQNVVAAHQMPGAFADSYNTSMKTQQQQQPPAPVPQPQPEVVEEKKFKCSFEGCTKRYKNSQGVRYHMKMAHQNQTSSGETSTGRGTPISGAPSPAQNPVDPLNPNAKAPSKNSLKPYKCNFCTKRYKTTSGLQNHVQSSHQRIMPAAPVDPSTISLNDNYQPQSGYVPPAQNEITMSPSQNTNVINQSYIVQGQQNPSSHIGAELNPGVTVRTALQNQMYTQARQLISANESSGASPNDSPPMYGGGRAHHRPMQMNSAMTMKTEGGAVNQQQSRVPGLTVTPMPQRLITQQRMVHNGNANTSPTTQLIRVGPMDQSQQQMSTYSSPSYAPQSAAVSTYGQIVQPGMMQHQQHHMDQQ